MAVREEVLGLVGSAPMVPMRAMPPLPLEEDAYRLPPKMRSPRQLPLLATATKELAPPPGAGERYTPEEVQM